MGIFMPAIGIFMPAIGSLRLIDFQDIGDLQMNHSTQAQTTSRKEGAAVVAPEEKREQGACPIHARIDQGSNSMKSQEN